MSKIFHQRFIIPDTANDANDHVNNVIYVQWMQDAAARHSDYQGCTLERCRKIGGAWVVRGHRIEYLRPAFAGEEIEVLTWVCNLKRTRCLRRYRFLRVSDQALLARAETDWVFVSSETGRPVSIPHEVSSCYPLVEPDDEPR